MKAKYCDMLSKLRQQIHKFLLWLLFRWDCIAVVILAVCLLAGIRWYSIRYTDPREASVRNHIVHVAERYLGCNEADGSHRQIIDRYNTQDPRPRDYEVTYEDSWCAVYTSTVAMDALVAGWIPLECSCEQQILLFDSQGNWLEEDCYLPKPGDYIYYDWNAVGSGDCRGWSDHVGIVVQTFGPVIKVIEGNKNDDVSYRYIFINDPFIRGFGLPDYRSISMT